MQENNQIEILNFVFQNENTVFDSLDNFQDFIYQLKFQVLDLKESLQHFFLYKNLELFDPHVGESACQIRANIIYYFYKTSNYIKPKNFSIYLRKLDVIIERLDYMKTYMPINYRLSKNTSVTNIINLIFCNFELSNATFIIYLCYFLTKYKEVINCNSSTISVFKIMDVYKISKKKAKKIIHFNQKLLSFYSCDYIKEINAVYGSKSYNMIFKNLLITSINGRYELPCFFSMLLLINQIKINNWDVIFLINLDNYDKQYTIPLSINFASSKYKIISNQLFSSNPDKVYYVFDIYTRNNLTPGRYIRELTNFDPKDLILSYMSLHPQYSNSSNCLEFSHAFYRVLVSVGIFTKYESYKRFAQSNGCSIVNPKFFFIQHISCQTLKKVLSTLTKNTIIKKSNIKYKLNYDSTLT